MFTQNGDIGGCLSHEQWKTARLPISDAGSRCHSDEQAWGGEMGEVEKWSGPCTFREGDLEIQWQWGPGWCECLLVSVDVQCPCYQQRPCDGCGLCCHLRPCRCPWAMLLPGAMRIWVAYAASWGQSDIQVPAAAKDHIQVWSPTGASICIDICDPCYH